MSSEKRQGLLVVISGPSGVGKDVMIERMAELGHDHHFTVTATTRQPRPGETDGVNHHFMDEDTFMNMITRDELLEWARVYDNYYGVPKQQIRDALARGKHVLLRVDVQGARRLRELVPDALQIFIMPPTLENLRDHLVKRGVDLPEEMEKRLAAARTEIQEADLFDYTVVNDEDELDSTVDKVTAILESESRRIPPRRAQV